MGKFADFNIKNNTENTNVSQSNSGGYNVQNTQVINEDLNINVPLEIIDLSKRATSVSGFWNGLNEYGKNLSLSLISSRILIGASIIMIIFAAFRELSYSLANKNMSGFWFISLKITNLFRIQALGSGGVITLILALTFLTLNGYVFHFEWN